MLYGKSVVALHPASGATARLREFIARIGHRDAVGPERRIEIFFQKSLSDPEKVVDLQPLRKRGGPLIVR